MSTITVPRADARPGIRLECQQCQWAPAAIAQANAPNDCSSALEIKAMAHDVRNIMASLSLMAEELATNNDLRIRVIAARLEKCSERVVAVCRNAERPAELRSHSGDSGFSLGSVLTDVLAIGQSIALPGTRISIGPNCGDGLRVAYPATVFRIIMNLVCNAARALNDNGGGQITLSGAEAQGAVVITVSDNGPGLPGDVRRWLAPILTDCASGRDQAPSGLTSSASAVQRLGGRLELVSTSRSGTTFKVVLPERMQLAPRSRPITGGRVTSDRCAGGGLTACETGSHRDMVTTKHGATRTCPKPATPSSQVQQAALALALPKPFAKPI